MMAGILGVCFIGISVLASQLEPLRARGAIRPASR